MKVMGDRVWRVEHLAAESGAYPSGPVNPRIALVRKAKRLPDCWINVYLNPNRPSGQMLGAIGWQSKRSADEALRNATYVGIYRLRIYLKPQEPRT